MGPLRSPALWTRANDYLSPATTKTYRGLSPLQVKYPSPRKAGETSPVLFGSQRKRERERERVLKTYSTTVEGYSSRIAGSLLVISLSWTESKNTALGSGHRRWCCLINIIAEPSKSIWCHLTPTPSRYSMHVTLKLATYKTRSMPALPPFQTSLKLLLFPNGNARAARCPKREPDLGDGTD